MSKSLQKCAGWGNHPVAECEVSDLSNVIEDSAMPWSDDCIAYGNGRSYGDSALWHRVVDTKRHAHFLGFDQTTGLLTVEAGCLLSEILAVFVPRGWFLKVSPGTRLITVGGAIASDVHGKNHHVMGCFSECVASFHILMADGEVRFCSRDAEPELFHATCGGQGLTGVIVSAQLYLTQIPSSIIRQTTFVSKSLRETFNLFEQHANAPYSVAWIDCLARGDSLGRAHVSIGDFEPEGGFAYSTSAKLSVPFNFPRFVLNQGFVKAFNALYYRRLVARESSARVGLDTFFYPLDKVKSWNKAYGNKGFIQYQFILPLDQSFEGMHQILTAIADAGKGSFLAVLKLHGEANDNWLSFPLKGYSLALDFKWDSSIYALLDRLDEMVVHYGGRIYLAKDSRVSKVVFEKGYPNIDRFRAFREKHRMHEAFNSFQSKRLAL